MTVEQKKGIQEIARNLGLWVLTSLVGWFALEARELRSTVLQSRQDQAVLVERVMALSERMQKVEQRLERHEEREVRR